jgi:diaminopimelate dehydrogenase
MKRRLAIIGLGRLGKACGEAIVATEDLALAGIVRRPESLNQPLPSALRGVAVAPHASELGSFDTALICLPTAVALEAATDLLQHRLPIVEATTVPSATYQSYKREVDRVALRHKVAAVIGAGGEPGMLSVFRGLFAVLCPKGPRRYARSARRQFAPYPRCARFRVLGMRSAQRFLPAPGRSSDMFTWNWQMAPIYRA